MERESKSWFPKAGKYPLFLLGLVVLVFGETGANASGAPHTVEAGIGAIGLALLVLSVVLG
jgi:hypothetical protein